ncbi:MAG: hypothetical protein GC184_15005 [Rhizobiales bacterium]|nr:hypothetical protein [Hyphomicrobiales bacterium]
MNTIFRRISTVLGKKYINLQLDNDRFDFDAYDIFFDWHSKFQSFDDTQLAQCIGIHILRDPRMVAVSAVFYHQRADEHWLHVPMPKYGGLTYQQKLASIEGFRDKLLFELDDHAGATIRDMQDWVGRNYSWCHDYKLEDLMTDEGLDLYHHMFRHVGFKGGDLLKCLIIAFNNSVFNPHFPDRQHIRSREVEHWRDYYDAELIDAFKARFVGAVENLGYNWD